MRFFAGIDPGRHGALAVVDEEAKIVSLDVMPTFADRVDPKGLYQLLAERTKDKDVVVYLEKAFCMPAQGRVSIMQYGIYAGYCEMAIAALGLPYELVMPQKWQADMHSGIDSRIKLPKIRSALKAQRLVGLDVFMTGKQTKPHDGKVDAFLIALFAQRNFIRAEHGSLPHPKKKKADASVA